MIFRKINTVIKTVFVKLEKAYSFMLKYYKITVICMINRRIETQLHTVQIRLIFRAFMFCSLSLISFPMLSNIIKTTTKIITFSSFTMIIFVFFSTFISACSICNIWGKYSIKTFCVFPNCPSFFHLTVVIK